MASSEENPAFPPPGPADVDPGEDGDAADEKSESEEKRPKKTLSGLGKVRQALRRSASENDKESSLSLPSPPTPPASSGTAPDDGEDTAGDELSPPSPAPTEGGDANEESDDLEEPEPAAESGTGLVEDTDLDTVAGEIQEGEDSDTSHEFLLEETTDESGEVPASTFADPPPVGPNKRALIDDAELDDGDLDDDLGSDPTVLSDSPFENGDQEFGAEPAQEVQPQQTGADDGEPSGKKGTQSVDEKGPGDRDFHAEPSLVDEAPLEEEQRESQFEGEDRTALSAVGSPALAESQQVATDAPDPDSDLEASSEEQRSPTLEPSPISDPSSETPLYDDGEADEDAFYSEETEIFDSPYEHEAVVPRLSILDGPATGQEFLLKQRRNTVGRGKNNTVVVSDLAMSRQHFEIIKNGDDSHTIIDLQSANGTWLNSTRIEEADLFHGDRLEAGKTEFQFLLSGDKPPRRPRNRHLVAAEQPQSSHNPTRVQQLSESRPIDRDPTDRILTYVIIGAGVLSLFLIAAALFLFFSDETGGGAETQVSTSQAQTLYLEGVERVKKRQWEAAEDVFEQVAEDQPDFPGVQAQLERVERESEAREIIERARRLLEEDDDEKAARLAMDISNESVYFDEAQELVRKTRQHRVATLYEKAQEAVTDEEYDKARNFLDAIAEEVPDHKGARELRRTVEESEERAAKNKARAEKKKERSARSKKSNGGDKQRGGGRAASSGSSRKAKVNFTEGFTLYKNGEFDRAASYFRQLASETDSGLAQRARSTAEHIESFAQRYQSASRALEAGAWNKAIGDLSRARDADKQVASAGYFASNISDKLATAHAERGLSDLERGNYQRASEQHAKAREYDKSNTKTRQLRRELSNKARALYIKAANSRKTDPDEAVEMCRTIQTMLPSDHDIYEKASGLLDELR